MHEIYEPMEDTFLILKEIRPYAYGNVLDMGTGSGVLALEAAKTADLVIGADLNEDALEFARQKAEEYELDNAKFVYSDLFSYFKEKPWKFDLIIFNPPYLPEEPAEPDEIKLATTGGKKGYEILERFFSEASQFLMPYGKILVVFSTLTGKDKVHSIIEEYGFNFQKLAEQPEFAETLFVYVAEKSDLLKKMEMKGITDVKKLTKGHRGVIFTGMLNEKKIAVKKQRSDIPVTWSVKNEARWLKVLNRKGVGPKLIEIGEDYFIYEFVEGEFFPHFLEKADKAEIKKVITDVFKQCFVMDEMKIIKEEMHNPYKHVIVRDGKAVLIDFERVHSSESPKNVTQFCQYVTSARLIKTMKEKGFKIKKKEVISAAKKYKKAMTRENLRAIISRIN